MEISARNSSTKIIAVIILSLTTLVFILGFAVAWLAVTNRALIHEQRTVVTPMTYNAPFVVSETKADTEYFRMMTLSFLALRLNVSPETVDSNHAFLLSFVEPEARERHDEISNLIDSFNAMLSEIENRDRTLSRYQQVLEAEVASRTAELVASRDAAARSGSAARADRPQGPGHPLGP